MKDLNHRPAATIMGYLLLIALAPMMRGAELQPIVQNWLRAQTNVQTWAAEVRQTRTLKTLTQPLVSTGQVWFAAPNQFRWEIGQPPKTLAVRQTNQLLVLYPLLRRAEVFPLKGEQAGPWKDTLALLEAGFPRNAGDLHSRFRVTGQTTSNELFELTLEPKSAAARRMMPELKITLSTNDLLLRGTQIQFTDGSLMRNDFIKPILNPVLAPDLFDPPIGKDYTVVEPLRR